MLEEIYELGVHLLEWEMNFVESLTAQQLSSPGYVLTKPQMVKIENIYERRIP